MNKNAQTGASSATSSAKPWSEPRMPADQARRAAMPLLAIPASQRCESAADISLVQSGLVQGGLDTGGAPPDQALSENIRNQNLRVFVHLAMNKDAEKWRRDHAQGCLVGVNDRTPYGYGRAESMGCTVRFSSSDEETKIRRFFRLALRVLLGFDVLHAWCQRKAFAEADIIWTHTESQYLAVASVLLLTGIKTRLLGQTVWLMDRWKRLNPLHKIMYRWLIKRVNVMTFHSELNHHQAQLLFPDATTKVVRFGIPSEIMTEPRIKNGQPIRILSLGNDRHRDWRTFIQAIRNREEFSAVILSSSWKARFLARKVKNITVRRALSNAELTENFENAMIVCIPLHPNLHASGLTAIQEAVLAGIPVATTDTGGLQLYFPDSDVVYVPPRDAEALRNSLLTLARDQTAAIRYAQRAQERMRDRSFFGVDAYVLRQVDISREVLGWSLSVNQPV